MDKDYIKGLLWGLFFVAIIHLLFGCTRTLYVPVERISHDTTFINRLQHDSIHIRDSIFLHDFTKGDTVFRERLVTRYKYKLVQHTDTFMALRTDTVTVPITTVRQLGWWEQTQLLLFVPLVSLTVGIAFIVVWLARKRQ